MQKVYLQFKSRNDLLNFLEKTKMPLSVIDGVKDRIICQLSEEDLEFAIKKYKAKVVQEHD